MIRSIDHLSKIAILEMHMYTLYRCLEEETVRILKSGGDDTVTPANARAVLEVASKHAEAEFEDVLRINFMLSARVLDHKVRKLPSAIIVDEIHGNFLALRQTTKREDLLYKFTVAADEDADTELASWLREVAEEEKQHEQALGRLSRLLGGETPFQPRFLSEADYRTYLIASHDTIFNGAPLHQPIELIRGYAGRLAVAATDQSLILELLRLAGGIYWSYCGPIPV